MKPFGVDCLKVEVIIAMVLLFVQGMITLGGMAPNQVNLILFHYCSGVCAIC